MEEFKTFEVVKELVNAYHATVDSNKKKQIKALIFTKMYPIIQRIARTIARRSYDPVEDLVQAGAIGLLKAIDNYNLDISENFRIYAGYLIIGEMKHYLRDLLNTIKVPANIQHLAFRINTFVSTLTYEELQELTNDDVAEVLNIPKKKVEAVLLAERRKKTVSLEDINTMQTNNLNFEETYASDKYKDCDEFKDSKMIVENLFNELPAKYKQIVQLYYYDGLSQKQIAEFLDISKMKVSRYMKKSFEILSELIKNNNEDYNDIEELG